MKNGNLFIIGDSYSTFEGYIPEECACYYGADNQETDVTCVEQTWWYQLIQETGANLVQNCSSSGTTVCNIGYDGADCSHVSFVARLDKLIRQNYFEEHKVDTFIVFGGTNDSWADSPIGELQYSNWEKADLDATLPAFCYLLNQVKVHVPNAEVVVIVNCDLKESIMEGYKKAAEEYGARVVALQNIDKMNRHPSVKGMEQIKEMVKNECCIKELHRKQGTSSIS